MSTDQEINVRIMIELLKHLLPFIKFIDQHLIKNVRLRTLKTKNEKDNLNIQIEPCYFDTSFIAEYKENSDNYSVDN